MSTAMTNRNHTACSRTATIQEKITIRLANWIDGVTQASEDVFLKAVDIVLAERARLLEPPAKDSTPLRH
jgi:hypothetical protein